MNEEESKSPEPGDCYPTESLSPMDFSTFVLSLASSAMVNLGVVDDEDESKDAPDLMAARQLIDIIGVLEEKTRGNLSESEMKLLKSLLYDLRVQYCDAQKR
jgi:hypothetical protein